MPQTFTKMVSHVFPKPDTFEKHLLYLISIRSCDQRYSEYSKTAPQCEDRPIVGSNCPNNSHGNFIILKVITAVLTAGMSKHIPPCRTKMLLCTVMGIHPLWLDQCIMILGYQVNTFKISVTYIALLQSSVNIIQQHNIIQWITVGEGEKIKRY